MDPDVEREVEKEEHPSFKWVACIAVALLITIASTSLVETRGDIRDIKITNTLQDSRLASLEATNEIQFNAIKQWKVELREDLRLISGKLDQHEQTTRKYGVIR
jgi:hypothetical protein